MSHDVHEAMTSIIIGVQRIRSLLEEGISELALEETHRFVVETDEKVWDLVDFLEGEDDLEP